MINKLKIFLKSFSFEGYIWLSALVILAIVNIESTHFTICPFNNLGIDFCPGCGLGKSIHHFIWFDFTESFNAHPLGGIAFLILLYRIFLLLKTSIQKFQNKIILLRS